MSQSPDGRTSTDASCYACNAPNGTPAPSEQWGVWMRGYGPNSTSYMWLNTPPPPPPNPYNRQVPNGPSFSQQNLSDAPPSATTKQAPVYNATAENARRVINVTVGSTTVRNPA